jgi:hypothetical protein
MSAGADRGPRTLLITAPLLPRKSRKCFFAALVAAFVSTAYVGVQGAQASSSGARHVVVFKQSVLISSKWLLTPATRSIGKTKISSLMQSRPMMAASVQGSSSPVISGG